MKIEEKLLTINRFSRPGTPLKVVRGVIVHWTGDPGASADAIVRYFESLKNQGADGARFASAHYAVGLEGEVVRCVPDGEMAWHVGARRYSEDAQRRLSSYPNNCTLGIELCIDKAGKFPAATLESGRALAALLLRGHGLGADALWRHYDVTGKICPKPFVEDAAAWEAFKRGIAEILERSA